MSSILKNLKIFLSRKQFYIFILLFFLSSLSALLEILGVGIVPVFIAAVLDYEMLSEYTQKLNITFLNNITSLPEDELLLYISIFIISLYVFKNLFLLLVHYLEAYFTYKITVFNSERLYKRYLFNNYGFHLETNSSNLVKNIAHEVGSAAAFVVSTLALVRESIIFILISVLLLINSPEGFIYIALFLFIILIIFYIIIKNSIKASAKKVFDSREKFLFTVQQSFGFIKELILLNKRKIFYDYFKKKLEIKEFQHVFMEVINKIPRLTFELIAVLICLLIVHYFYENSKNQILPILSLYGVGLVRMIPSYTQISSSLVKLRFYKLPFDFICDEIEKNKLSSFLDNDLKEVDFSKNKLKKDIKIQNLSFNYTSSNDLFENLNLTINFGEVVGIIGKSGSGKTTFADILLGLHKPKKGKITYSDIDITEFPNEWRKKISYVPQEIFLIDSDIKSNIAVEYDPDKINYERLNYAIKLSNCDEFINQFKNKLDTKVGERGSKLSGGQRQRIGIARALYRNPDVIVFDEPTSALDDKNEQEIFNSILNLKKHKTLICISHNLDIMKRMDKVLKIENKKISIVKNN